MSFVYSGVHSITFIDSKNTSLVARSWLDWHLVPTSRPLVNPAPPNISLVQIPGSNRTIDLTEALTGIVTYGRRTGSWDFIVDHDKWSDWNTAYNTMMSFINGKRLYCVLEDDHATAYQGRFTLKSWKSDANYSTVTIDYDLDLATVDNEFDYSLTQNVRSLSAVYSPGSAIITTKDSLSRLKRYLTVTATYDTGSSEVTTAYSLSGDISTAGNKTITVSCGGATTTFVARVITYEVTSIDATYNPGSHVVYAGNSLDTLKPYITVTATYSNGESGTTTDYSLSGDLSTAGTKTVTVSCGGKTDTFSVVVNVVEASRIEATYSPGDYQVLTGDSVETLRPYTSVRVIYNDGTTHSVSTFTLSGDFSSSGYKTVTVVYEGMIDAFGVQVYDQEIVSVSAVYTPGSHVVYTGDSLDSLKPYLEVSAEDNTGLQIELDDNQYTLSGSLSSSGTKTITVGYAGKTTTFTVTVSSATLNSISAVYDQASHTPVVGDSLDSLKPYLTVTGSYSDGATSEIAGYTLNGGLSSSGTQTIAVSFLGKNTTFTVTVAEEEPPSSDYVKLSSMYMYNVPGDYPVEFTIPIHKLNASDITTLNQNYYPVIHGLSRQEYAYAMIKLDSLSGGTSINYVGDDTWVECPESKFQIASVTSKFQITIWIDGDDTTTKHACDIEIYAAPRS